MVKDNPNDENGTNTPNGFDAHGDSEYDPQDYEARHDAQTLADAENIKAEPNRHSKAVAHLKHMRDSAISAHANARRSLMKKTGGRLKKVFGEHGPQDDDETPFEAAEKGK
jgi:hypothetical protein